METLETQSSSSCAMTKVSVFLRLFLHLWRHIREMLGKEVAEPQKIGKLNAIEKKGTIY